MSKLTTQVAGVVAAVSIFAVLSAIGYFSQLGLSQTFGPTAPEGNTPAKRAPNGNRAYGNRADSDDPDPRKVDGWKDVPDEDLTNEARLRNRPGNFHAIPVIVDFLDGLYQVEPEYRNLAYPFQLDSKLIESEDEFEGWRKPDKTGVNRIRRNNIEIVSINVFNLESDVGVDKVPESLGFQSKEPERLQKLRESHTGRLVLVSLVITTEALDSDETRSDEATRFALHRDSDGHWKIVYCVG